MKKQNCERSAAKADREIRELLQGTLKAVAVSGRPELRSVACEYVEAFRVPPQFAREFKSGVRRMMFSVPG